MKKIAIIGGAGFIGSHLVNLYGKTDSSVHVFDNFSTGNLKFIESNTALCATNLEGYWSFLRLQHFALSVLVLQHLIQFRQFFLYHLLLKLQAPQCKDH